MRKKIILMLLVAGLLCVAGWTGYAQRSTQSRATYEYQVVFDPTETGGMDEGLKKLNEIGSDGWELAGVNRGNREGAAKLYFRRLRN
jgi:hypothetical protein